MLTRGINTVAALCSAILAIAFTPSPAKADDSTVSHVVASGWMATDFHDQTNPGCSIGSDASAPGGRLMMGANRRRPDPMNLLIRKTGWLIPAGTQVHVKASFPDGSVIGFNGRGNGQTIEIDIATDQLRGWLHELTSSAMMQIVFGGNEPPWTFDLSGTTTVVNAMGDCFRDHQISGVAPPFDTTTVAGGQVAQPFSPAQSTQPFGTGQQNSGGTSGPSQQTVPSAPAPTEQHAVAADKDDSCGEPETSNPAIVSDLNSKIGTYGGPPEHVVALRGAPPRPLLQWNKHTKCLATLVFDSGKTQNGLLLTNWLQGVANWRWHSDEEIAQGANSQGYKKAHEAFYEDLQLGAETSPKEMVGCGIGASNTVYTTRKVCYEAMMLFKDNLAFYKPYTGTRILQECATLDERRCLVLIEEMRFILINSNIRGIMPLIERCAIDLGRRLPENKVTQNMNICQELIGYFINK